ncbi:MAG: hypothetical protein ACP5GX_05900 [Anaerolineae bacterium]
MNAVEDRALLQRFEPIIRYTRGERFFPMDVEPYVDACSLWLQRPHEEAVCLIPESDLTLEDLTQPPKPHDFDAITFLKFIEPLNIAELAAYEVKRVREGLTRSDSERMFRAGLGRLARVGYVSRFVDAIFSISLLARGRVPGDTAAAAAIAYERILARDGDYRYYGRVLRQEGWIVLQYWFFYAFNNWRSGFYGVNDHEADWEQICIYLYETEEDEVQPEWVAYASHDFSGDDLRRRWDDPEVEKVGEHPVIYASAGSHASYYAPGEYLTQIEISFLSPLVRITEHLKQVWRRSLRQVSEESIPPEQESNFNIFRVPFVDYARGDGRSIGPGQEQEWSEPILLNPVPTWAREYRGLWGLYARDPISGENAPAGPLYDRDGTLRRSWYDPLGWAGLDKVPPPAVALVRLQGHRSKIQEQRMDLLSEIAVKHRSLTGLGLELQAMHGKPHLKEAYFAASERVAALSDELAILRAEVGTLDALLEAFDTQATRLEAGKRAPLRFHISHAHHPATAAELRMRRAAELWAALSIGLMMVAFVALALFSREHLVGGLVVLLSLFIFVEAGFRGRLIRLISSVTTALAVVAALVLLFEFFWEMVVVIVLLAGGYLMLENLRELWS